MRRARVRVEGSTPKRTAMARHDSRSARSTVALATSSGVPLASVAQRSARLRHDLRNQVQVVNALAERGELELAEQHIDAMLKELDGR